jgi:predicted CXXCH cytochrome family protein
MKLKANPVARQVTESNGSILDCHAAIVKNLNIFRRCRMKKVIILALAVLMTASIAVAGPLPGTGITGSPHDFSSRVSTLAGEICRICHAPHNPGQTDTFYTENGLLWNHDVTTATYTMYSSGTLNGASSTVDGHSKLCLSCHDGTVAVNAYEGYTGTDEVPLVGDQNLTTDLRGTHPISITFTAATATADGYLVNPETTNMPNTSNPIDDYLDLTKLQCSTCHDVHNSVGETFGAKLLRETLSGSAICLACHVK